MVLKAACPALAVTLIEPRKNRFFFLKHMARTLHLKGVEVLDIRLEEHIKARELSGRRFSFITSRAFTDIPRFISLASPYMEKGGRIVLMKGPGAVNEIKDLERQGRKQKIFVAGTQKFQLPFSKGERLLVSIRETCIEK